MTQFEEQKALQMLQDGAGDETARLNQLSEVLKKITTVTTRALAQNIALIKTPTAAVTDINHIDEWLANCDRQTYGRIRDHIVANKAQGELQPLSIQCTECQHEFKQSFTLDMTNFFAAAS